MSALAPECPSSSAASVLRDARSTVTAFFGDRRTNTVVFADEVADLRDAYGAPGSSWCTCSSTSRATRT